MMNKQQQMGESFRDAGCLRRSSLPLVWALSVPPQRPAWAGMQPDISTQPLWRAEVWEVGQHVRMFPIGATQIVRELNPALFLLVDSPS